MRIGCKGWFGVMIGWFALLACEGDGDPYDPSAVRFDTVAVVGVADGSETETFGEIRAVEPASDGGFFLLDGQARSVSWFAADGSFEGVLDSRGEGPGELAAPTDIAFTQSGALVVLDPSNRRFSWFLAADSGLVYQHQRRTAFGGSQFCALGDRLYVNVPIDGAAVHELGDGEEPVRSFGTPISTPGTESLGAASWLAESMVPAGPTVCVTEPDLVVMVGRSSPIVRAYDPDGTEVWEVELLDFRPVEFQVTPNGGVTAAPYAADGTHMAVSASRWDDELLLLQYELRRGERSTGVEENYELESRFLELATGREVYRTSALPHIAATTGQYTYEQRNLPVPQVAVLSRRRN